MSTESAASGLLFFAAWAAFDYAWSAYTKKPVPAWKGPLGVAVAILYAVVKA